MAKRVKCKMCKVKRKEWEEGGFFGIRCNKHFTPMIVLKEHKAILTKEEAAELKLLLKKYYPNKNVNKKLTDSDTHWHLHIGKGG